MKKVNKLLTVILLVMNIVMQPLSALRQVGAEEYSEEMTSSLEVTESDSDNSIEAEPEIVEAEPSEVETTVVETTVADTTEVESTEVETTAVETAETETTETETSVELEESEEDLDAITAISFEPIVKSNLRTGSEFDVPVLISVSQAALEGATLRYTVPSKYISAHANAATYFPGYNSVASVSYDEHGNLVIDYPLPTLVAGYNEVLSVSLKSIDNGSMPNGASINVRAQIVKDNVTLAQTSNTNNYNFVIRQPQFRSNITYPSESSDDDEEGDQQTLIDFELTFGENGVGNGSGLSDVTSLTIEVVIPEGLAFDAEVNPSWTYNEASRVASYKSSNATLLEALALSSDSGQAVDAEIIAYADLAFANGDIASLSNQEAVSLMATSSMIMPMAAVEGNYITSFGLTINPNGDNPIVVADNGEVNIDPDDITELAFNYSFTFPNDVEFGAGDTYTVALPDLLRLTSDRTNPETLYTSDNSPYNFVMTTDNQLTFTFPEGWETGDQRKLTFEFNGPANADLFDDERQQVISVPYADNQSFTFTINANPDGFEGADTKSGSTDTSGNYRPTEATYTVIVNDAYKIVNNAKVVDELSDGHTLIEDSIEVKIIEKDRNNNPSGTKTPIDTAGKLTTGPGGFTLNLGNIEDTYEITYRTAIDQNTNPASISNSAVISWDGEEPNTVTEDIDLNWGADRPQLVKTGSFDEENASTISWSVDYNFSNNNIGTGNLSDTVSDGEIVPGSIVIQQVSVDQNGNATGHVTLDQALYTATTEGNTLNITIPDAGTNAYVVTYKSTVPPNIEDTITNQIVDNNSEFPGNAKDEVVVDSKPEGDKSGSFIVENGIPYAEWTVTFNQNKTIFDEFSFTDTFNATLQTLVPNSWELKVAGNDSALTNYTVTPVEGGGGFRFVMIGTSLPQPYTFTYRTQITDAGLTAPELLNNVKFEWGKGIGAGVDITVDGPGVVKTNDFIIVNGEQRLQWDITFNNEGYILTNPVLTDTFTPANVDFYADTLEITYHDGENTHTVPANDYVLEDTGNGFKITFNGNSQPHPYTVSYQTSLANDNAGVTNAATLDWQGVDDGDKKENVYNSPGHYKDVVTVTNADGSRQNNWEIRFNTNNRIISGFSLTDRYTPSDLELVGNIKLEYITDGSRVEVPSTEYVLNHTGNTIQLNLNGATRPNTYVLSYSTSYNEYDDSVDNVNGYSVDYIGKQNEETGSKTVEKRTLAVEKASVTVDKTTNPVQIEWTIKANPNGFVTLRDAELIDTIPTDQRLLDDSIEVGEGVTLTKESANSFTLTLPDGPNEHTITYRTEILTYPSNNGNGTYSNEVDLINYKNDGIENNEVTAEDSATASYFEQGQNNNPGKTGGFDYDTDIMNWEVTINPEGLPIRNAKITDHFSTDSNAVFTSNPAIQVFKGDSEGTLLTKDTHYTYTLADDGNSFEIVFLANEDTGEVDKGISHKYTLVYSAELDPNFTGMATVTNTVQVIGENNQVIDEAGSGSTNAEKWYIGSSGSATNVNLNVVKRDKDSLNQLGGVVFRLSSIRGSNTNEIGTYTTSLHTGLFH